MAATAQKAIAATIGKAVPSKNGAVSVIMIPPASI